MRKKRKKKLNIKRIVLLIIIIIFITNIVKKIIFTNNSLEILDNLSFTTTDDNGYKIIKQDENNNYSGVGQEKVSNKDGYYTTFTTNDKYQKTYIEYKQNGDAPWANNTYWNDPMEKSGCGITAMAIILSGYGKNVTPEDLRNKYYPVIDYDSLNTEFAKSYGIESSGFFYDSTHLSQECIQKHLLTNRPILVCVWNKPSQNRWTTTSHYMVLLASDDNNMVYISNPNRWKK